MITVKLQSPLAPTASQSIHTPHPHFPTAGILPLSILNSQLLTRTLTGFSIKLLPREIPMFRGAIAEFAGFEEEVFHNHDAASGKYHLGYPLIQYHVEEGRAAITAVGEGAAAMERMLSRYDGRLWIGQRWQRADIVRMVQQTVPVGTTEDWHTYTVRDWVPFNADNYREWQRNPRRVDRLQLLERTFVGQVITFARGVGWWVDRRLEAQLLDLSEPRWKSRHGQSVLAFDATFRIQALLPEGIGIGKGVSLGYGRIMARE